MKNKKLGYRNNVKARRHIIKFTINFPKSIYHRSSDSNNNSNTTKIY